MGFCGGQNGFNLLKASHPGARLHGAPHVTRSGKSYLMQEGTYIYNVLQP